MDYQSLLKEKNRKQQYNPYTKQLEYVSVDPEVIEGIQADILYTNDQLGLVIQDVDLKADKANIIAQINLSTEGVTIAGSKINITGNTTFNALSDSVSLLAGSLGNLAYEDQVQLSQLGTTVVVGGYIKTSLLDVDSIFANNITATGTITGVTLIGATLSSSYIHAAETYSPYITVGGSDEIRSMRLDGYANRMFFFDGMNGPTTGATLYGWIGYGTSITLGNFINVNIPTDSSSLPVMYIKGDRPSNIAYFENLNSSYPVVYADTATTAQHGFSTNGSMFSNRLYLNYNNTYIWVGTDSKLKYTVGTTTWDVVVST